MTRSEVRFLPRPPEFKNFMENPELQRPVEKEKLKKFVYRDNSAGRKIIFECVASGILEADKMYEKATGKNPEKQNHVGCSVEKIGDNQV